MKTERCPSCAKLGKDTRGDNLAVYQDGHSYCYSCGYYGHPTNSISNLRNRLSSSSTPPSVFTLPSLDDPAFTSRIPIKIKEWLYKYYLKDRDIIKYHIKWNDSKESLLFPIIDKDEKVIFATYRYFGINNSPRYYNVGYKHNVTEPFKTNSNKYDTLILVEDYISAIRVSQFRDTFCLFGSYLDKKQILRLSHHYARILLWLDSDKIKEAFKQSQWLSQFGIISYPIYSDKDPKAYSPEQINEFISHTAKSISS